MRRYDLINHLIQRNGYQRYLEIGVEKGRAFAAVQCPLKHGVDPASPHATHPITSDEFFFALGDEVRYDLIFVDGLHVEEQVLRDIENALRHLNDKGVIVVHDCNPPNEWFQRSYEQALLNGCRGWNGTVWRAFVRMRATRSDLEMCVVDADFGCGLVRPGQQDTIDLPVKLSYPQFELHRSEWLGLISVEEFLERF